MISFRHPFRQTRKALGEPGFDGDRRALDLSPVGRKGAVSVIRELSDLAQRDDAIAWTAA